MDLTGEYTIPAKREAVWAALNDPDVLKVCMPGCDEMEKTSDTQFSAKITAKIGAVRAKLKGEVTLSDIDAPNSYTITGAGKGGVAGFAKGGAKVSLSDGPDGATILTYHAQADLGGKLAAVGSRVIQGVAKKMADDFFGKFARVVSGEPADIAPNAANVNTPTAQSTQVAGPAATVAVAGRSDWLKIALVNAAISSLAVAVAVALVSN